MEWLLPLAFLVASLAVLYKSSEALITHASIIARFLRISETAVGFFLLSVATSLPELSISVQAALSGNVGISVGNVFGANVADILLVMGAAAFFSHIAVGKQDLREAVLLLLGASLVTLFLLTYDTGRFTGFLLMALFVYYSYRVLRRPVAEIMVSEEDGSLLKSSVLFCVSVAVLLVSSKFVLDNAVLLSDVAGLSKTFIGATLISLGTVLPELSVTLSAAHKRRAGMAAGTVVGGCVVNLTLVLGAALALGNPIPVNNFLSLVVFSLIANNALVYFFLYREKLERREGLILLGGYVLFLLAMVFGQVVV